MYNSTKQSDGRFIRKTKPRNWGQWAFVLAVLGACIWIVLTTVAMFYYPGGTYSNHDMVGYSFWSNFFSDLGRQVALSGDPNTISRSLFNIAYWGLGLVLCLGFAALPYLFAKTKSARRLATIGSIFGIISGVIACIVFLVPWDIHPLAHMIFDGIMSYALFFAVVFYCAAILRNQLYHKVYAYVLIALMIIWFANFILTMASPSIETAWGNRVNATAQKIDMYALLICISIQAYGASRVYNRLRDLGPD